MKIFEFRIADEKDWVAEKDMFSAIKWHLITTDHTMYDIDEVVELPEDKWEEYKITDENGVVELSFADWMKINTTPDIIASTTDC